MADTGWWGMPDFSGQASQNTLKAAWANPAITGLAGGDQSAGANPAPWGGAWGGTGGTSPYAFVKNAWSDADPYGSTKKIYDAAQQYGWSNDQLGQGLGFTGQQVGDHFAKYGFGGATGGLAGSGTGLVGTPASGQTVSMDYSQHETPQFMKDAFGRAGVTLPGAAQDMMYAGGNPNFDMTGGQGGSHFGIGGSPGGNPYLSGMADDIQRRVGQQYGQQLSQIGTHAVGVGGLGGSRQGVAQGLASQGASDSLAGQLANLYGNQYNADANRGVQVRGQDQNFSLGLGGLANQRYGQNQQYYLGLGQLGNQRYGMDQNYALGMTNAGNQRYATDAGFYTQQRAQDMDQQRLGMDMDTRSLQNALLPYDMTSQIVSRFLPGSSGAQQDSNQQRIISSILAGLSASGLFK